MCDECDNTNRGTDPACKHCRQRKQSSSTNASAHSSSKHKAAAHHASKHNDYPSSDDPDHHHHPPSKPKAKRDDYDDDSRAELKHSKGKGHAGSSGNPLPVYISDFPLNINDDNQLENHIRRRVEKTALTELTEIRCYPKLGVGVMYVKDKRARDHLLDELGTLAWDPKEGKTMIKFDEEPNLISYLVFDTPNDKADCEYPTSKEISQQWETINHGERLRSCEQLNMYFPNIYRLVSTSLDQLINSLNHRDIRVKKHLGQIYCCADCSFFEDLHKSITTTEIERAIANAIKEPSLSSSSLYVQLNKQSRIACVIAANEARKWATMTHISIDGKSIVKCDELTFRVHVHPVPKSISSHDIIQHPDFDGKATVFKQSGENLILNISDKHVFDQCIRQGAIRLDKKNVLHINVYSGVKSVDGGEIDCETWYESDMLKCTKPNIMTFVNERDHFIFRCKWNAKIWIEQFNETASEASSINLPKDPRDQRGTDVDIHRHQLQMTVMLNTLASIRHGRYFLGDQTIKLNINKRMKTIVYNHQSTLRRSDKMPTKIPFDQTKIKVEEVDCVVAYLKLLKKGKKPVLLNMASATSPGGGYRKGDGAQEENLFRRSDYFRSLDVEMDDFLSERSDRFQCSSDSREESLSKPHKMYPIDEFGGIYTSGLTFFRHSQDVGYEYLDRPIEDVSAIAMAAYRDPKLEEGYLSRKAAVGTRKKIENVFSIAYHHGHESIVLSAFGCGAFRNPPVHVARIFLSVIEQYAGFFDTIVFAIIDDHNAGQKLNPHGNLKPFLEVLDGKSVKVETTMNKPNTMFGPFRVSSNGSTFIDIKIFDANPCFYAARCNEINDQKHTDQYSHPPLCARAANFGKCDLVQHIIHDRSFIHRKACPQGGNCDKIKDKKHADEFEHPSECPQGAACQNMDDSHLKQFRHKPLCDRGIGCLDYQKRVQKHCEQYRHCQPHCAFGKHCVRFHDKNHIREEKHPFITPCPRTPFHCLYYDQLSEAVNSQGVPKEIQQHCLDYSHVCRFGRNCKNTTPLHQEKSIHIIREVCPFDGKCTRMHQEEHLNSFTHANVADIRRMCRTERCTERYDINHIQRFRHAKPLGEVGLVRYDGLNRDINFVHNQCEEITRLLNYIKNENWSPLPSDTVPPLILNWFRTVRPVHRCNPVVFESILLHGHAMSRDYMENLKKPKFVATSVMQHSRIRRIKSLEIQKYSQFAKEYITAVISEQFERANFPHPDPATGGGPTPMAGPRPGSPGYAHVIKEKEKTLRSAISSEELEVIRNKAIEIAQASIKLHTNPAGIGHAPDKALGTHKRVFSILGPHLGHYYGDVFIVFKREILHHPDSDYSMNAATTFGTSGNAFRWRPWLGADPVDLSKRIAMYHDTKLHASIPGHEYAIALEIMALTSLEAKSKSMDIDLDAIIKRWLSIDSHKSIEAHLPQLIPLDYIERIYVPKNIFESLNESSKKSIDAIFKHCFHVAPYTIPVDNPTGTTISFTAQPPVKERAEYQEYVVNDLLKRFRHAAENIPTRPIEGTVITIHPSDFENSFLLPLTISQAHDLYCFQNKQNPPEDIVYIYWQALNGDMMLVISADKLEAGKDDDDQPDQHGLLCYIAPKYDSDVSYHEPATYLNYGSPFKHHAFVKKNEYRAKSNTFHLGSNTDDFITYCLEIHRSTNEVVLRQAGANAIYNHEEISYQFQNKKELDVSKLEYVHVSANARTVTVRNLIICFEKRPELHPTFDRNFKKSGSKPTGAVPHAGGATAKGDSSLIPCRDNVNCLFQHSMSSAGKDHNTKYSHPCRFSELCRNKDCSFIHDPHRSSMCRDDKKCRKLTDPSHRAEYRHTDLPDFLSPCRDQKKCPNTADDHRMKFSHGEQVFQKKPAAAGRTSIIFSRKHFAFSL